MASACGKGLMVQVGSFALSATSYYHACEHITRKSRADSCTHCLHARYKCRAGVTLICALTGWSYIFHFGYWLYSSFYFVGVGASTTRMGRGIDTYAKHVCQFPPTTRKTDNITFSFSRFFIPALIFTKSKTGGISRLLLLPNCDVFMRGFRRRHLFKSAFPYNLSPRRVRPRRSGKPLFLR